MIGDSWSADIVGANGAGIDQVYYSTNGGTTDFSFKPTYHIDSLECLYDIL